MDDHLNLFRDATAIFYNDDTWLLYNQDDEMVVESGSSEEDGKKFFT